LIIPNTKFPKKQFNLIEFGKILTEQWEIDDSCPEELSSKQKFRDDVTFLLNNGIPEIIARLLISKTFDHVKEAIRFFDACLKTDD
jgi:hypothetical protein